MSEYISNELCHFVGKSLHSFDEQFDLLVKILRDKRLLIDPRNPNAKPHLASSEAHQIENTGEIWEQIPCVCFCDIPSDKLSIHSSKYSRFGIGFQKQELTRKGVRPVHYIPTTSIVQHIDQTVPNQIDPKKHFRQISTNSLAFNMLASLILLNPALVKESLASLVPEARAVITSIFPLMIETIQKGNSLLPEFSSMMNGFRQELAYLKFFDPELPPIDSQNYYYEREWRSLDSIPFEHADITTIYLPSYEYQDRFRNIFPTYVGKYHVIEEFSI